MYEYVKPSWMPKVKPSLSDDSISKFGAMVPARPLNPSQNEKQSFPVTGSITDVDLPRY